MRYPDKARAALNGRRQPGGQSPESGPARRLETSHDASVTWASYGGGDGTRGAAGQLAVMSSAN